MGARFIAALTGVWLMASPAVLGYGDPARANDRIIGPIIASVAIIALSQVTRAIRWLHVPLGAWLLIAPWLLAYPLGAKWSSIAAGVVVIVVAFEKGKQAHRFGGGWSSLWKRH